MDSNKILIGSVVVIVAFLAFPIVMKQVRGGGGAVSAATQTAGSTSAGPATADNSLDKPEYNEAPILNETTLIGTDWRVLVESYTIKLTFAAGGVCYATSPLIKPLIGMDYVEGRWRINYDKVNVEMNIGPREVREEIKISGDRLYHFENKKKYTLMKRF